MKDHGALPPPSPAGSPLLSKIYGVAVVPVPARMFIANRKPTDRAVRTEAGGKEVELLFAGLLALVAVGALAWMILSASPLLR
jgi:hypothetical protein